MKKKLVSLMLVAAMTASLTACGSKKTEEPTSTVHKSITAAEYDAAITSDAAIYKKAFTNSYWPPPKKHKAKIFLKRKK